MSVATEIARIKANLAAAYTAVGDKGGEVPSAQTSANLAAAVGTITTPSADGWVKPDEWPDLHKVLADYPCPDGYPYACALLIDGTRNRWSSRYGIAGTKARTSSAPDTIVSITASSPRVSLDPTKAINGTHWIVVYSSTPTIKIYTYETSRTSTSNTADMTSSNDDLWVVGGEGATILYNCRFGANLQAAEFDNLICEGYAFDNCTRLQRLTANTFKFSAANGTGLLNSTTSLRRMSLGTIDATGVTNMSNLFAGSALEEVPLFDTSGVTNVASMFANCYRLRKIPQYDFGSVTNAQNLFYLSSVSEWPDVMNLANVTTASYANNILAGNRAALLAFPTHLSINTSFRVLNGAANIKYYDKSNFAAFDDDGVVNGGMVYNMNEVDSLTMTVASDLKSLFTEDEQSAIEDALTEKGWQISW